MSLAQAMPVIVVGQRRQDPAVGRCTSTSGFNHMRQLCAQHFQPPKLGLHAGQLFRRDLVGGFAGALSGCVGKGEQ